MPEKSTRERILAAALFEFDEKGYEAATVATICQRAGVSNGSFFHAYPSKEAVADAVFLAVLEAYHDALVGAVTSKTSAADGVAALVTAHVRWVMKDRLRARFMFLHGQHAIAAGFHEQQTASNERFRQALSRWYEPNIKRGTLHAVSSSVLISQIIGPVQMFCRAWLSGRSRERPDAHLPALIACAVRAVVPIGETERNGQRRRWRND